MGRVDASEAPAAEFHAALWARARWLRLGMLEHGHTAAENEYQRLDRLKLPAAGKTARLRDYLAVRGPDVDRALARLQEMTVRFGEIPPPVRRLRVVLPEDSDQAHVHRRSEDSTSAPSSAARSRALA